jgi:hypothetical protein
MYFQILTSDKMFKAIISMKKYFMENFSFFKLFFETIFLKSDV